MEHGSCVGRACVLVVPMPWLCVACVRIDCGNAVVSGEDVIMGVSLDTFITCVCVSGVEHEASSMCISHPLQIWGRA